MSVSGPANSTVYSSGNLPSPQPPPQAKWGWPHSVATLLATDDEDKEWDPDSTTAGPETDRRSKRTPGMRSSSLSEAVGLDEASQVLLLENLNWKP